MKPEDQKALRKWAELHLSTPAHGLNGGLVQARLVIELLDEAEGKVTVPPCGTAGHYADCDCRWAATGEGGY